MYHHRDKSPNGSFFVYPIFGFNFDNTQARKESYNEQPETKKATIDREIP